MQPRLIDGVWIASTAVDGYWGDSFELDVANQPWGPWTTIASGPITPRDADPKMNTYHAHLMPWRDIDGNAVVAVSNNARNMARDAWPHPERYRPNVFSVGWGVAPSDPPPAPPPPVLDFDQPTTTVGNVSSTTSTTTTTTTTVPASSSTSTTSTTSTTTTTSSTTTTETVE